MESPPPGLWKLDAVHFARPLSIWMQAVFAPAFAQSVAEDGESTKVDVLIVAQSEEQNEVIGQMLVGLSATQHRGGSAFLAGSFYSGAYAEMVAARYRALNVFAIVDTHVSAKAERRGDEKSEWFWPRPV